MGRGETEMDASSEVELSTDASNDLNTADRESPTVESDAASETREAAALPSDSGSDAEPPSLFEAGDMYLASSCAELRRLDPTLASGEYPLRVDGREITAYCDMDMDGGGWTAFFAGQNGSLHIFGKHEYDVEVCDEPSERCIRKLPDSLGDDVGVELAVECGEDAVGFSGTAVVVDYFRNGAQRGWVLLDEVRALKGAPILSFASKLWTGSSLTNSGWIISLGDNLAKASTFAAYYEYNANWSFCNGRPDEDARVRLYYR